jgi:hypothetical protein
MRLATSARFVDEQGCYKRETGQLCTTQDECTRSAVKPTRVKPTSGSHGGWVVSAEIRTGGGASLCNRRLRRGRLRRRLWPNGRLVLRRRVHRRVVQCEEQLQQTLCRR